MNEQTEACRKAAAIGFAQSLENCGYSQEKIAALTTLYAREGGILQKRAAAKQVVWNGIVNTVNALRAARK